MYSRIF